jgi:hypothetical protein
MDRSSRPRACVRGSDAPQALNKWMDAGVGGTGAVRHGKAWNQTKTLALNAVDTGRGQLFLTEVREFPRMFRGRWESGW